MVNIDQASNRPYGGTICYDQNGNLLGNVGGCPNLSVGYLSDYTYDNSNRLRRVASSSSGSGDQSAEYYNYTADNKRVSTIRPNGTVGELIYVYGAKNEIAAICTSHTIGQTPVCGPGDLKFAGRVIRQNGFPVTTDRLGSVIGGPSGTGFSFGYTPAKYYMPYGEQWNTANGPAFPGNANFATYFKDQSTGLDYADQRFYNSTNGFSRFMSADPYQRAATASDSESWNKYAYTRNDPINRFDPSGLFDCPPGSSTCVDVYATSDPVPVYPSDPSRSVYGDGNGNSPVIEVGIGDTGGGGGGRPNPCPQIPKNPDSSLLDKEVDLAADLGVQLDGLAALGPFGTVIATEEKLRIVYDLFRNKGPFDIKQMGSSSIQW